MIGLHRGVAQLWGGASERKFVGADSPFETDYAAAGHALLNRPEPVDIALLSDGTDTALLISMPLETTVVSADDRVIKIAQVHFAPDDWSFDQISSQAFDDVQYVENKLFLARAGAYVFFDACWEFDEVGAHFLEFQLQSGMYSFSSAVVAPADETMSLMYYKIVREDV